MTEFNPLVPSIARVCDYLLGGRDNFKSDRDLAERQIAIAPIIPVLAKENRQFLARAVTWAAAQGIAQFVDLGCGLPTDPNTHECARTRVPDAKVVYADNDPVVIAHLNALIAHGDRRITVAAGDVREPRQILQAIWARLDLTEPVCLIFGYLLHFATPDEARALVADYAAHLARGSCVIISVVHADCDAAEEGFAGYSKSVAPVYNHSAEDFTSFLGALELVPPGAVDARRWQSGIAGPPTLDRREGHVLAGVARGRVRRVEPPGGAGAADRPSAS